MPGSGAANAAGLRIQQPAVLDERVDAGHEVGTPHVARRAATGRIDDRNTTDCRTRVVETGGRVAIEDVRPGHEHVDRHAAARVDDATHVPATEHRLREAARIAPNFRPSPKGSEYIRLTLNVWRTSKLLYPSSYSNSVFGARVVGRRIRSVGAAGRAVALAERVLHVHREPLRRPAVQGEHQRVVAVMAAAGLEVDLGVRVLHAGDVVRPHRARRSRTRE